MYYHYIVVHIIAVAYRYIDLVAYLITHRLIEIHGFVLSVYL